MRVHKRPPQGTIGIVSEEQENRLDRAAERLAEGAFADANDHDLGRLKEAMRTKNTKVVRELLPRLKEKYGNDLYTIMRSIL